MDANSLRTLLLVKAVEEHDDAGALLPAADRDTATRSALRQFPRLADAQGREMRIEHAERVAAARARELYTKLAERHPVVARTVMLEGMVASPALLVLGIAFLAGLALSLVDSRVRIEIVAFPLIGVVLWNLVVYVLLAIHVVADWRARREPGTAGSGWLLGSARWGWRRALKLIKSADFYHRALAAALRDFSNEWWRVAQPLLLLHGQRLFHFASAALACGLVAGFYVRGIGLEYRAGWESTFLGPEQVRGVVRLLYGPASLLTGIPLPSTPAEIEALHWRDGAGGAPAAMWIHLMAATAMIYVVVPRVLLGLITAGIAWGTARSMRVPDTAVPYIRRVLAASDAALPASNLQVTPYAYVPDDLSLRGADLVLHAVFGPDARIAVTGAVAYGDEAALAPQLAAADVQVLLLSLAATPEAENHGTVLATLRDQVQRAGSVRLLLLVDEAPMQQRMRGDTTLAARIEERRQSWRNFAAAHGLKPCFVDLRSLVDPGAQASAAAIAEVGRIAMAALA